MAEAKVEILVKAKDEASKQLKGVTGHIEGMSKQMKIAGGIMMGAGIAIAAGFGMAMKAAAKEEAGIVRLSVAMKNMGISYDESRESLEAWIDAQQQKTAVADNEQRESLASLIRITGDLAEAQDLLTLSMDIAVGMNKDLAGATGMLMYALSGNWGMIERYIPALKTAKTEEEKWLRLRELFAGQAEAYGKTLEGQMKIMEANIGDIKEAVGGFVADAIIPMVSGLSDIILKLKETNPEVMRLATYAGLATSGLLLVGGGFLLLLGFLPNIIRGFTTLRGIIHSVNVALMAHRLLIIEITLLMAGLTLMVYGLWTAWRALHGEVIEANIFDQIKKDLSGLGAAMNEMVAETFPSVTAGAAALNDELAEQQGAFTGASQAALTYAESLQAVIALTWPGGVFDPKTGEGLKWMAKAVGRGYEYTPYPGYVPTAAEAARLAEHRGIYGYQRGGVVPETGLAFLHKGETVIPGNTIIQNNIYLDGEPIAENVISRLSDKVRLQGAM